MSSARWARSAGPGPQALPSPCPRKRLPRPVSYTHLGLQGSGQCFQLVRRQIAGNQNILRLRGAAADGLSLSLIHISLAAEFDELHSDNRLGQASWEAAETQLQLQTARLCLKKAHATEKDVSLLLAGDLQAQCTACLLYTSRCV